MHTTTYWCMLPYTMYQLLLPCLLLVLAVTLLIHHEDGMEEHVTMQSIHGCTPLLAMLSTP